MCGGHVRGPGLGSRDCRETFGVDHAIAWAGWLRRHKFRSLLRDRATPARTPAKDLASVNLAGQPPLFFFDNLPAGAHILLAGGSRRDLESSVISSHRSEGLFAGRVIPFGWILPGHRERRWRLHGSSCAPVAGGRTMAGHPGHGRGRGGMHVRQRAGGRGTHIDINVGAAGGGLRAGGRVAVRPLVRRRRASSGSAATATPWKSACPTRSSATGSSDITPTACWKPPRQWRAGRWSCRSGSATRANRRWAMWSRRPRRSEPEAEPRRRQTVKIPGNPKAPLSFPTP